jgi:Uma2 family endonuclease
MILGCHDVAQPDILVVTNPSQISGRGIEGAPLLVVEVLSPSTRRHDREVKMRRYAALAIPHYWIVDPEGKWIACYRLAGDTYRELLMYEGDVHLVPEDWPDLTIALADLWR